MWIMLTRRIPTEVPVPKLSVHWSTPWPHDEYAAASKRFVQGTTYKRRGRTVHLIGPGPSFGREPNWEKARKIRFRGESIRVFPHEFSEMPNEKMRMLISGGALELREQDDVPTDPPIDKKLIGEQKVIYEEALVAGCDHAQAMMVCFGIDPTIPDAEFPPVGWYKCRPEYAAFFCEDWEMEPEDVDAVEGQMVAVDGGEPVEIRLRKPKSTKRKRRASKKSSRRPSERRMAVAVADHTPEPSLGPIVGPLAAGGALLDAYLADPDGTMARLTKNMNRSITGDDEKMYTLEFNGWLNRYARFTGCLYGLHATAAHELAKANKLESKEIPGNDERALEEAGWAKLTKGQWYWDPTTKLTQRQQKYIAAWCTDHGMKAPEIGD